MDWLNSFLNRILATMQQLLNAVINQSTLTKNQAKKIDQILQNQAVQFTMLSAILSQTAPPIPKQAVGFFVNLTSGDNKMAVDIQLNDNGTATATVTYVDSVGLPATAPTGVTPTWVASDATPGPSALTLTPSADGNTCGIAVNTANVANPPQTGLTVAATVASGLTGQTAPITETSQGIDIVAGPASNFKVTLSEP